MITCDMASAGCSGIISSISNAVTRDMASGLASDAAERSLLTVDVALSTSDCEKFQTPPDAPVTTFGLIFSA